VRADTDRAPRAGRDVWIEEGRKLQGVLGYTFRDPHLLHQALTVTANRRDPRSHQRFALVGDAVVALYALKRLVDEHPDWTPAMLDRAKGKLVSNSHLGHIARQMGLTPYVIRPKRVRVRWWTLASVLEAILWAIFADSGEDFGALARAPRIHSADRAARAPAGDPGIARSDDGPSVGAPSSSARACRVVVETACAKVGSATV
jgi:dsRNA-specific ribonuclease